LDRRDGPECLSARGTNLRTAAASDDDGGDDHTRDGDDPAGSASDTAACHTLVELQPPLQIDSDVPQL
jgi:hypothetical protein